MDITVILCTYNRCESLARALDSVAAQILPESIEWEVLVTDNNSNDQTRDVVKDRCHRYPGHFRYLFESQQGKSHALNAGIREARGDILAFTDDDVTVEPTWLHDLTAALHTGEWGGAGGRTLPERTFLPPRWLSLEGRYALGPLAAFDRGLVAGELTEPPVGNNMAFRKQMFEKYGGFRTDLGPRPGSEIRNEDTEFARRLLDARERLRYEPSAVVYHAVPDDRLQRSYFLAWYFDYGRANVREWGRGPHILGIPRRCFTFFKIIATVLPLRALLWMTARSPQRRFFWKCWARVATGQVWEIYRQWRKAKGKASDSTPGPDRVSGI